MYYKYLVIYLPGTAVPRDAGRIEDQIKFYADGGWRLHSFVGVYAVFEKERQEEPIEAATEEERPEEAGGSSDSAEGRSQDVLGRGLQAESDKVHPEEGGGPEVEDTSVRTVLSESPRESAIPKRNEICRYKLSFSALRRGLLKMDGPISTPCDVVFPGFAIGKTVCEKETPFHVIIRKPGQKVWGRVLAGSEYHQPEIGLFRKVNGIGQVYYGDLIDVWQVIETTYDRAGRKAAYAEMEECLAVAEATAMGEVVVEKLFERMGLDEDDDLGNWFYSGAETVAVMIGMETMVEVQESRALDGFEVAPGPRQDYRDDEYFYNRVVDTMGGTLYHRRPR